MAKAPKTIHTAYALGRCIGVCDGEDIVDHGVVLFFNFKPVTMLEDQYVAPKFPRGDVTFDFNTGQAFLVDEDGKTTVSVDFVPGVGGLPIDRDLVN